MNNLVRLAAAVKEGFETLVERCKRNEQRIEALEAEIARLKQAPHKPFRQKLQERNE